MDGGSKTFLYLEPKSIFMTTFPVFLLTEENGNLVVRKCSVGLVHVGVDRTCTLVRVPLEEIN